MQFTDSNEHEIFISESGLMYIDNMVIDNDCRDMLLQIWNIPVIY